MKKIINRIGNIPAGAHNNPILFVLMLLLCYALYIIQYI